jgi:hypothetical protein
LGLKLKRNEEGEEGGKLKRHRMVVARTCQLKNKNKKIKKEYRVKNR